MGLGTDFIPSFDELLLILILLISKCSNGLLISCDSDIILP